MSLFALCVYPSLAAAQSPNVTLTGFIADGTNGNSIANAPTSLALGELASVNPVVNLKLERSLFSMQRAAFGRGPYAWPGVLTGMYSVPERLGSSVQSLGGSAGIDTLIPWIMTVPGVVFPMGPMRAPM